MSISKRPSRVTSRRRLSARPGLHRTTSTGRLPSHRPPDAPKGPDVVELVTSIGEAIASQLAAQISSSLEMLRLDVSSSATKDGHLDHMTGAAHPRQMVCPQWSRWVR
uniref:Uncharacterized protein n=1 Tax=Trichuris muris TaxID=70415 RepID=A0A5S6QR49_TRIMR